MLLQMRQHVVAFDAAIAAGALNARDIDAVFGDEFAYRGGQRRALANPIWPREVAYATGAAGFAPGVGPAGAPAALDIAALAPPESMMASVVPTLTVSPTPTSILRRVPATSDGTSVATLSVSISSNNSSTVTLSPSFLCQAATVPSSTVSPTAA